jgi:hypothetical protein
MLHLFCVALVIGFVGILYCIGFAIEAHWPDLAGTC